MRYVLFVVCSGCCLLFVQPHTVLCQSRRVRGVYREEVGMRDGFHIWIVDGSVIRREIDPEFLFGGNPQRYLYVPKNEIWIDNAISSEEYYYTVAHEFYERDLMAVDSDSYYGAHEDALTLEHKLRLRDSSRAAEHERELPPVLSYGSDSIKELPLPDTIRLSHIYKQYAGKRDGLDVWIVDGAEVRKHIYPDFGMSGNDLAYYFIPKGEIWIDNVFSCEETEYSILSEVTERKGVSKGEDYGVAYERAVHAVREKRERNDREARNRTVLVPKKLYRVDGTGDENHPEDDNW